MIRSKADYTMRVNGAVIKQFRFENGWGASVHKPPLEGFWQLGVTGENDELCESVIFPGSLAVGLLWRDVEQLLTKIRELEER